MSFSYDLVLPLRPFPLRPGDDAIYWEVIEKGSEKTDRQEYKISFTTLELAMCTLSRQPIMKAKPCYKSSILRDQGFDIYLRTVLHQSLPSIKERGVIYTLLKLPRKYKQARDGGVIAISTGSFAYILCFCGNLLKIPVTVVMPKTVADDHVRECRATGSLATVVVHGNDILEAHIHALHLAHQRGLFYLDGNDHPYMIIGQATLGLQIVKEMRNVNAVILPTAINNCGLTTAMAMAIKGVNPEITIFEVKFTDCDPLVTKIRSQTMSEHELIIPVVKYQNLQSSKQILFDCRIKTNKETILTAAKILHETERISDYYAAIGLAPIVDGALNMLKGKRVIIPLFGEMDMAMGLPTLTSDPSVSRAGPSTSRE